MSDEITVEGQRQKREARLAAQDDKTYAKEANIRQVETNYLAITHVLALVLPTVYLRDDEVVENIQEWQEDWKNTSSGATGEVLTKIAGLVDLEPTEILNPGKNINLKSILKEKAMIVAQNGKLANFISKNIVEIDNHKKSKGEEIRWAIGIKDEKTEMSSENIQQTLDKKIKTRKNTKEAKSLFRDTTS
jgi:hypothetical protein